MNITYCVYKDCTVNSQHRRLAMTYVTGGQRVEEFAEFDAMPEIVQRALLLLSAAQPSERERSVLLGVGERSECVGVSPHRAHIFLYIDKDFT